MRLGLSVGPEVEGRFELARRLGAKGVMAFVEELAGLDGVDALVKRFAEEGLEIAQVGCWAFNPLHPTDADAAHVERAIELAAAAGPACTVVFGAGGANRQNPWTGHPDNWTKQARRKAAKAIRPLARFAKAARVRLVLEPHLVNVARNASRTRKLLDRIGSKNVGVSMDVVNYCTYEAYWDSRCLIDELTAALAGRCFAAHLKDVSVEERLIIHLNECAPGQGNLDYPHLLARLDRAMAKADWAIIEHTPVEALEGAVRYVLDKAEEAGVIFA